MQEKLQTQIWSTSSNRKSKPPHPIRSTASWTCHFKRFLSHLLWVFLGRVWTLITHGHHWQNRLFLYFSCNSFYIIENSTFSYVFSSAGWRTAHGLLFLQGMFPTLLLTHNDFSEESKPSSKGDSSHGVQCSSRETDNAKLRIKLTLLILMSTLFYQYIPVEGLPFEQHGAFK